MCCSGSWPVLCSPLFTTRSPYNSPCAPRCFALSTIAIRAPPSQGPRHTQRRSPALAVLLASRARNQITSPYCYPVYSPTTSHPRRGGRPRRARAALLSFSNRFCWSAPRCCCQLCHHSPKNIFVPPPAEPRALPADQFSPPKPVKNSMSRVAPRPAPIPTKLFVLLCRAVAAARGYFCFPQNIKFTPLSAWARGRPRAYFFGDTYQHQKSLSPRCYSFSPC